jgi:hypothetical protein
VRAVQLAVVPEPQAGTLTTAGYDLPSKKTHRGTRKVNRPKRRMKSTQRKASQQGLPFIKRRALSTLVSSRGSRETSFCDSSLALFQKAVEAFHGGCFFGSCFFGSCSSALVSSALVSSFLILRFFVRLVGRFRVR